MTLKVEWVKPNPDSSPSEWVLRVNADELLVEGDICSSPDIMQNDLSFLWYVASPDETMATFDPISGSIFGTHDSVGKDYWLSY